MSKPAPCLSASAIALDGAPAFDISVHRQPNGQYLARCTGHDEVPPVEAASEKLAIVAMSSRVEEYMTSGRLQGN